MGANLGPERMLEGLELVRAVLGALLRQHPLLRLRQHPLPRHHVGHILGDVSECHWVGAVSQADQIVEALLRETMNARVILAPRDGVPGPCRSAA
jgi:hypothetical protein